VTDKITRLIELEYLRCGNTTSSWRVEDRAFFIVGERGSSAVSNPDVILGIDCYAGYGTKDPVIG
jgi:hypothetical protein